MQHEKQLNNLNFRVTTYYILEDVLSSLMAQVFLFKLLLKDLCQ